MTDSYRYQPPVGVWRTTAARRLLWAAIQLRHRIERDIPERPKIDGWIAELAAIIVPPVVGYRWEDWFRRNVAKADEPPDGPLREIAAALGTVEQGAIHDLHLDAAATRASNIRLPFDPADLEQGVRSAGAQVAGITDTIRVELQAIMREVLDQPDVSQFEFADRIRSAWPEIGSRRATVIAVTEWNRAASVATLAGYRRMGVERKVWYTVGDRRVCPVCETNASEGEIPINRMFGSGDDGPPAHPMCRCNVSAA